MREISVIRSLVVDRAFLDGKSLYAIDQQGIEFVIPLKSNMEATRDARSLALEAPCSMESTREVTVTHGYGKNKFSEKVVTTLVGVPGLLSCDWFNPEGSEANTTFLSIRRPKNLESPAPRSIPSIPDSRPPNSLHITSADLFVPPLVSLVLISEFQSK
ncbi:MAG: hypothetical protein FJ117_23690 [Deltaproteobacteria bacterium]|nr:hypothetical protein [Deltaproteobacteria bacterium]